MINKNKYAQHQKLLQETFLFTQKIFPNIRLFQRHVGLFYTANGTPIQINKKGMADAWGLIPIKDNTFHIEIEFKTGKAQLSTEQKNWKNFCDSIGVLYILVRKEEDIVQAIQKKWAN